MRKRHLKNLRGVLYGFVTVVVLLVSIMLFTAVPKLDGYKAVWTFISATALAIDALRAVKSFRR